MLHLRGRARIPLGSGTGLARHDEPAPRKKVVHSERGGLDDGRDLASDGREGAPAAIDLRLEATLPEERVAADAQEREKQLDARTH